MVSAHGSISPPPPPIRATTTLADSGESPSPSYSFNPSLIIIAAIIAFVCVASASIHLLLRFLSRPSSSSSSQPPTIQRNPSATSSSSSSPSDHDRKALLDSLPLFSLASSLAALPKSSPDCAVCLSKFEPDDQLRLLPSCRHAFHSPCIDTWIQSTPSCPLCRSTIQIPPPPPPPPEPSSFRIEIGSVSSRRDLAPPHVRSYSLGSSFEYRVEDDVEAVLASLRRMPAVENPASAAPIGPPPPGAEVADSVGSKAWLKEYVDRLLSSASSSFSSLRFSSRRFDGSIADASGVGGGGSWDSDVDGNDDGSRRSSSSYNDKWRSGAVS